MGRHIFKLQILYLVVVLLLINVRDGLKVLRLKSTRSIIFWGGRRARGWRSRWGSIEAAVGDTYTAPVFFCWETIYGSWMSTSRVVRMLLLHRDIVCFYYSFFAAKCIFVCVTIIHALFFILSEIKAAWVIWNAIMVLVLLQVIKYSCTNFGCLT